MPDMTAHLSSCLALADSLPEPRLFLDAEYRILAANRAWRETFAPHDEVVGRRCHELSHHSAQPCETLGENCPLTQSRKTGQPARCVHVHHTPNGTEHVDVEVAPIRAPDGQPLFYVETVRLIRRASSRPAANGLVGQSPAFRQMMELVERVAPSDATVLLLGESGAGKELVAQALHEASRRANGPFVVVDCAGMTETLAGSELFGHEKGAFTGAVTRKIGLVEMARGGTLFFDEIGDVPLCLQVKLLRLIETGTFRRVGGVETLSADFRLVLATHRNLEAMIEEGSFRRDLYYRISAFPIYVPSLRERREDIPLLAASLLARISRRPLRFHPAALERLMAHHYPGNVRELRNIIERAVLLADGEVILPEHLPTSVGGKSCSAPPPTHAEIVPLAEAERRYLAWALAHHRGDRETLARRLGISARTLYRKLGRLGAARGSSPAGVQRVR